MEPGSPQGAQCKDTVEAGTWEIPTKLKNKVFLVGGWARTGTDAQRGGEMPILADTMQMDETLRNLLHLNLL